MTPNQSSTPKSVTPEKKSALKSFEAKLAANAKIETNIPFNRTELDEHWKQNPGAGKVVSGEYNNRKTRRESIQATKPFVVRQYTPEPIQNKLAGRMLALGLLETQLKRGTKPAKENGFSHLLNSNYKIGDQIPLKEWEKVRIENQIDSLKRKLMYAEKQESHSHVMNSIDLNEGWSNILSVPAKPKQQRSKNPVTKLYQFIAGKYQRK